ncbi:Intramembrane protease 1 [Hyphodiscus hymeniophilus]|uniref:Intramembrane protease 1 n=1 Tax=Hyphodiscus hymeniophilus TaxID=353542 RepID=A0A9P6VC98_9HELO|nr:Intramembrane protease 1 [Hyphodiscus hymeniophilus]
MDKFFSHFDGDSRTLQFIGEWGCRVYDERELIQMYIHLIISALFPIYIGAHASLRRPPSAAEPKKSKAAKDEDDDEVDVESTVEGLSPSDAILFPVLAGLTLTGLYFLIKWIQDPKLLNKILNYYFSLIGVFGVGKIAADSLNVATTFVFPSVWSSRGKTYMIDPLLAQQVTGKAKPRGVQLHHSFTDKTNPFPGLLSSVQFPAFVNKKLWTLRALLRNHWIFRGYIHGIVNGKSKVQINDMIGLFIGIATIIAYNVSGKAWWLLNIIGFGFCYGTLQLMSPTTFWTGSMVLAGLFVYDIVMVFYTPMMITVATSLEAPIKLVFPGPGRGSMLGLGDVVLPGIMMALALRFDLYLHYLRHPTRKDEKKAPYHEATGKWGERFWTWGSKDEPTIADGARFKKVYFKASLIGYVLGLVTTLVVLNIFKHGQPALFYLVPTVLGSLWGTAFLRGDFKLMWGYTEDGSLDQDEDDKEKQNAGDSKEKHSEVSRGADGNKSSTDRGLESSHTSSDQGKDGSAVVAKKDEHAQHVFLFSLTAPKQGKKAVLSDKS